MKISRQIADEIPAAFLERMAGLLGDEYPAFLSSLRLPAISGLRINSLKLSVSDFLQRSPWDLAPVPWCLSGFILKSETINQGQTQPGKHPYHSAGLYYLQEPSAMAAAEVLSPQPGETVLDLAAAPGGKATHIAALMNNAGVLVANEIHPRRVWDLAENLERSGVTNAVVTSAAPYQLANHFGEYFDRVLVDAPCSGEGMFRKGDTARREWKPGLVRSCSIRQASILEQAARLVKPGGCLVYTTCTFSPEENEGVIACFLAEHPEFELANIQPAPGFSTGHPEWAGSPADASLNLTVRIWPHLAPAEGHFIASLIKQASATPAHGQNEQHKRSHTKKVEKLPTRINFIPAVTEFCQANLVARFDTTNLALVGSYIYQLPVIPMDLWGLKVLHPGWWLGSIKKDRFTPSHALAMGIRSDQAGFTLSFAADDPVVSAYLAGESIPAPGEDAWVLVTVDDYSLGWGKRVQGVLKNYYPHGLRRIG